MPLFQEGVTVCGFPVAKREEDEGLEIPLQLPTMIAGVKGSMEYEGDTIYVGPSRILFPTRLLRITVQWHYIETNDKQILVDTLSIYKNGVRLTEISNFDTLRTFLGSYKHALVYAGTKYGI